MASGSEPYRRPVSDHWRQAGAWGQLLREDRGHGRRAGRPPASARRHGVYERWAVEQAVGFIATDSGGPHEIAVTGCSFGAFHAVHSLLRRSGRDF